MTDSLEKKTGAGRPRKKPEEKAPPRPSLRIYFQNDAQKSAVIQAAKNAGYPCVSTWCATKLTLAAVGGVNGKK